MANDTPTPNLEAIKQKQQQTWSAGDFSKVAATITIVSERLVEAADLVPGERVLDVATGSGNTAIAAARRFCDVTGVDYVPALLEHGRERAAVEGLEIEFVQGDAEQLPCDDDAFDVVLSSFGAMFAPDQERTAAELVRVCRPGGRIAMANWTPSGFIGELFKVMGRHVPPPAGLRPPSEWGSEIRLRELFADRVSSLAVNRQIMNFRYRSPEHFIEFFRTWYGPTKRAFEALDEPGQAACAHDIAELIARHNRALGSAAIIPSEYVEVIAVAR